MKFFIIMNSTFKLLLLNCVILVVFALLINNALTKRTENTKLSMKFPSTLSHESQLSGKFSTTTDPFGTSTMKAPAFVVPLANDGLYFAFKAPPAAAVDLNVLEKVGDHYYKSTSTAYYKQQVTNECDNTNEEKMVELSFGDQSGFVADGSQTFARDSKNIFVDFYKVKDADPLSFTFIGQSKSKKNDYINTVDSFWYKDTHTVHVIVKMYTACEGKSILEDLANQNFKNVDLSTFEYIGFDEASSLGYAKDKNFFYSSQGVLSETVVPSSCQGDFFRECLPRITASSSPLVQ